MEADGESVFEDADSCDLMVGLIAFLDEKGPFHDPSRALSGFLRADEAELGAKDESGVDCVLTDDVDAEIPLGVTLNEAGRESALIGLRTNGDGFRVSG